MLNKAYLFNMRTSTANKHTSLLLAQVSDGGYTVLILVQ